MIAFFWIIDSLIPITMIVAGRVFKKNPPRTINSVLGYRTSRSMKSQEAWDYAHQVCGNAWFNIGLGLLVFTVIEKLIIPIAPENLSLINSGIGIIALLSPIPYVEHKLKSKFDA